MSRCCDHSHQQPLAHPEHVHDHAGHNHEAVPQPADAALTGACNTRIRIEQMDCPTEERLIRDALGRLPGVAGLHFNLLQRVLTVSHDEGMLAQVLPAIRALGFTRRSKMIALRSSRLLHRQKSAGVNSFAQIKKDLKPYMGQ